MWLRLVARTILLTLVMVQLSAPDDLPQKPGGLRTIDCRYPMD